MTDSRLTADALFVGATLASGFATVSGVLAFALTDSVAPLAVGMLLPIAATLLAARDYGGRTAGPALPNQEGE
ncbi:hypothetical protein DVK02_12895 [Halobellus sp. Atlit-31R]|nr:hypothetical protein DVK02_12895 [Halobellus sp. Atlit-31R]